MLCRAITYILQSSAIISNAVAFKIVSCINCEHCESIFSFVSQVYIPLKASASGANYSYLRLLREGIVDVSTGVFRESVNSSVPRSERYVLAQAQGKIRLWSQSQTIRGDAFPGYLRTYVRNEPSTEGNQLPGFVGMLDSGFPGVSPSRYQWLWEPNLAQEVVRLQEDACHSRFMVARS